MKKATKRKFTGNKICTVVEQTYSNAEMLYLGDPKMAQQLTETFKITKFFLRKKTSKIATIGWSPKKGTGGNWYGWSHRAIGSFPTRRQASRFAQSVA